MNVILTIAGSDPSGGAGIQADIKTITSIGAFAATAITAITCQNSLGVQSILPLEPSLVQEQIKSVLADLRVSHIKIGMTGTPAISQAIHACLTSYSGEIILDPVLKSSSGTVLTDNPQALSLLIDQATVLTPNTLELSLLSGLNCSSNNESLAAGKKLFKTFANLKAICLKGGHLHENRDEIADTLLLRHNDDIKITTIRHLRHQTRNSHGTGCTFASAFSAFHARYHDYEKAFTETVHYVDKLLEQGKHDELGKGTGPLVHYRQNR